MWPFLESPIESHIWQSRLYVHGLQLSVGAWLFAVWGGVAEWIKGDDTVRRSSGVPVFDTTVVSSNISD